MTDAATNNDAVRIVVDGNEIEARKGELVIAAAERAGVYIPRFCYHPRMKPVGMCRMCLVEVKGPRGFALQPACFIPVAEGQEVVTQSEKVKKAQDGVLEFLLINHPLDCPVCDKGGECPLQDQTLTYGPGESRFVEEKRHREKPIELSNLVYMDRERCVLCDRCTRFSDEIAGEPLIEFINRGDQTEVNVFPDHPFASYFSGNTVQICPVGALLARPYRFKARPWDLEQVESTCTTCAVGCRMAVQSTSNQLVRHIGVDSDPVNQGWLCDKGRFDWEAINSEQRFARPMVRKEGEMVEASWGEALASVASVIEAARNNGGARAIGIVGGARLTNEDAYAWTKLAKSVIGTDSVDCQLGDGLPAELVLGVPRATIDEACSAPAVVLLAPDLREELPVLFLRLRQAAVDRGLPVIEISPQRTSMSRYARHNLLYRPGEVSDVASALAWGADTDVAGVGAADLAAARQTVEDADGVVVVLGRPSLAESGDGLGFAADALRKGLRNVKFLSALRRGNVHGALDMGMAPGILPGRVSLESGREWFTEAWGAVPKVRGADTSGILRQAADGQLDVLVLLGSDPLRDFPDRLLARQALERAGTVIVVDTHPNASQARADVVLPAAAFSERGGTTTNIDGRITRVAQKITPPGVAWPDWMIASELAVLLGGDLGVATAEELWDEIERFAPSHNGITRGLLALERDGVVAPLRDPFAGGETATSAPATDVGSGATESVSEAMIDPSATPGIVETEVQGVPMVALEPASSEAHLAPRPNLPVPARLSWEAPLVQVSDSPGMRLISGRKLYDLGVMTQYSPSLALLNDDGIARLHPQDFEGLGLAEGDSVRVESDTSAVVVAARADTAVPQGSVSMTFNTRAEGGAPDLIDVSQPFTTVRLSRGTDE